MHLGYALRNNRRQVRRNNMTFQPDIFSVPAYRTYVPKDGMYVPLFGTDGISSIDDNRIGITVRRRYRVTAQRVCTTRPTVGYNHLPLSPSTATTIGDKKVIASFFLPREIIFATPRCSNCSIAVLQNLHRGVNNAAYLEKLPVWHNKRVYF